VALAVAHRVWLASAVFALPADAATVGLMARHILEGERPLFMYGYFYSGAPVAYVTAFFFRFFGSSMPVLVAPFVLLGGAWVWMLFLLFRALGGPRVGLAAALIMAVPDWTTSYYTFTPDCSYGAFLFLVTTVLWAAVSIDVHDCRGPGLWARAAALGAAAGLAFWTNALSVPYFAAAAIPLARFLWRRGLRAAVLGPFLLAVLLALPSVLPCLPQAGVSAGSANTGWLPSMDRLAGNARVFFAESLPKLYLWVPFDSATGRLLGAVAVAAAAAFAAIGAATGKGPGRARVAVPLAVLAVFFLCFLPHEMANIPVPRYLLPFWTTFVLLALAWPLTHSSPRVRSAAGVGIALWLIYNTAGAVALIREGRPLRDARFAHARAIIDATAATGARYGQMLGDYYFGQEGTVLSFLTGERPQFVATGADRRPAAAQAAELEPHPVYICHTATFAAAWASLSALGVRCQTQCVGKSTLIHGFSWPPDAWQAVPAEEMRAVALGGEMRGRPGNLLDRRVGTALLGGSNAASWVVLDLGRERPVRGLVLLPGRAVGTELPMDCRIEISRDGRDYADAVRLEPGLPVACRDGPQLCLASEYGRFECRFGPLPARYLRITGRNRRDGAPAEWIVSEAIVYEAVDDGGGGGGAAPEDEWPALLASLDAQGVRFAACDRWLSARLRAAWPDRHPPPAFERFSDHSWYAGVHRPPRLRVVRPAAGVAAVVPTAVADEQESVLCAALGRGRPWCRTEFGYYTAFVFARGFPPDAPGLVWTGLLLLP
jgi:hypothetical protein